MNLSPIWPSSAALTAGVLSFHGIPAADLLDQFGSPLYLLDLDEVLSRARAFRDTAAQAFPTATTSVSFAGKAFLSKELVRLLVAEGLHVDTCSLGEMRIALAAGVPGRSLVLHGNNKSDAEIELAVEQGFDKLVIDSADEPARVAAIAHRLGKRARVMVRVTTGIHAGGHEYISTAHEDQKFGIPLLPPTAGGAELPAARGASAGPSVADGASAEPQAPSDQAAQGTATDGLPSLDTLADGPALAVLQAVQAHSDDLELVGLHSHIGSQIQSGQAFVEAARRIMRLREAFWRTDGFVLPELDLGGGYAVAYRDEDQAIDLGQSLAAIAGAMRAESQRSGLPLPVVSFEPGRWIVAPAGVSLYTVGTVKPVHLSDGSARTYVSVDGGMGDNIRPALYDARYTAMLANRAGAAERTRCRVVGLHCESGDILVHDVDLPVDIQRGDLLAVPVTGAYGRTMASNYNQVPRPPVVAITAAGPHLMIRRDSLDDLLALDQG